MPASTTTETRTTPVQNRGGKRGHRARGRGGPRHAPSASARRSGGDKTTTTTTSAEGGGDVASVDGTLTATNDTTDATHDDDDDVAICWICAEPVKYYSLSACNHRTCHVCALRLRALYKKLECTFCKEPQSTVIFTTSATADFASYTPDAIPYKDAKLAVFFETEDMMAETLVILRFNCPEDACEYVASGWGDLKLHTRAVHGKVLCDLCIKSKRVFAHEHAMYAPAVLPLHLPSIPHRPSKQAVKEPVEGGTHPLCAFCRECFFGDDELYVHMRERHEECFLCKRREVRDQYFQNWDALELHFSRAHFACTHAVCQAQKFVVFDSELDLKGHQVEVHGADMSSKDRRDARRVQAEFEFDDVSGGGRRGRREREREPPPPLPSLTAQAQAQGRAGGRRREAFGGYLTTEGSQVGQPVVSSGRASPIREDVDPLVAERHAAFLTRLQHVAPNPTSAVAAVKAAMRGYRANESSARDLISTVWHVLDGNLDDTASVINGVVDVMDEEEKKRDLLAAWNGFKIEHRQEFPELVPMAVGSGYAGIASGRVLNAARRSCMRQTSRQVWDRVAQAASASSVGGGGGGSGSGSGSGSGLGARGAASGSGAGGGGGSSSVQVVLERFPPLAGGSGYRQVQRQTPWVSSSGSGGSTPAPVVTAPAPVPVPALASAPTTKKKGKDTQGRPPTLSAASFPELPSVQTQTQAQARVKSVLGNGRRDGVGSVWRVNGGEAVPARVQSGEQGRLEVPPETTGTGTVGTGTGKGKKGKGKQKQTLFTLGSFPT